MTNEAAKAQLADLAEMVQGSFAALARAQRDRARLTASARAGGRRVTVTVNADGVVIKIEFSDDIDALTYSEIAAAVTSAAQEAAVEVKQKSQEILAELQAEKAKIPALSEIFPLMPDIQAMMPTPPEVSMARRMPPNAGLPTPIPACDSRMSRSSSTIPRPAHIRMPRRPAGDRHRANHQAAPADAMMCHDRAEDPERKNDALVERIAILLPIPQRHHSPRGTRARHRGRAAVEHPDRCLRTGIAGGHRRGPETRCGPGLLGAGRRALRPRDRRSAQHVPPRRRPDIRYVPRGGRDIRPGRAGAAATRAGGAGADRRLLSHDFPNLGRGIRPAHRGRGSDLPLYLGGRRPVVSRELDRHKHSG
ncbi:YbaB/EbfC family nucleoid-associated protein [Nocardia tengchongensis]|uniref:YbaB/EbfC family nucleoid-associated protein n=1 Tax=Nocardia tengchongensis TaxID=2055889 RepID=A0ABX8CR10_9NOCA|nr:YbaB/EbfC family nucleoid-associated protein [Nocardia tengchongensis]